MSSFKIGDRVRATSSWTGKSDGKGTVVTVDDRDDGCGVELDRHQQGRPAHYYDSELTKINKHR